MCYTNEPLVGTRALSTSWLLNSVAKKNGPIMRPQTFDIPNALDLISELDQATEQMMSIPVDHIGGAQWEQAFVRQQSAFRKWRDYLYCKADERPAVRLMKIA